MPKPNPNRQRRQPTPDSPPPRSQGAREAPGDQTDWIAVGHEEADDDAVRAPTPNAPGGSRAKPPRS